MDAKKQFVAKRDSSIYPQNYKFQSILHMGNFYVLKHFKQPKSTVELSYMCPRGQETGTN